MVVISIHQFHQVNPQVRASLERTDRVAPREITPSPTFERAAPPPSWLTRALVRPSVRTFVKTASALAAACLVSVLSTWWVMDHANRTTLFEREVLNAHLRSLLQDSPVQVASSDQHTVRPWFAGRADFAPAVKNLAAEGFSLVGGRLDYVADRRVSALVYKRRLHVINVFLWPSGATADSAARISIRNGYNLVSWSQNGVTYWAVSDLNAEELRALQGLL
jgi:anti-sigma factor RsiW